MVLGDFNAKHSAWYDRQGTDAQGAALKLLTDSHGLHQIIASPTYVLIQTTRHFLTS